MAGKMKKYLIEDTDKATDEAEEEVSVDTRRPSILAATIPRGLSGPDLKKWRKDQKKKKTG